MSTIRPATREDFISYYEVSPPFTVRGIVVESSTGMILAFGGYYLDAGVAIVFSDHRENLAKPRDIVRGGKALMTMVKDSSLPAIAGGELDYGDTALRHFGFRPKESLDGIPLYRLEKT